MNWQQTSSSKLHCSSRPMARQCCPWMVFDAATRCAPAGSSGFLLFSRCPSRILNQRKNMFSSSSEEIKIKVSLPRAWCVSQELGRFARLPLLDNNAPLVPREDLMVCESLQRYHDNCRKLQDVCGSVSFHPSVVQLMPYAMRAVPRRSPGLDQTGLEFCAELGKALKSPSPVQGLALVPQMRLKNAQSCRRHWLMLVYTAWWTVFTQKVWPHCEGFLR